MNSRIFARPSTTLFATGLFALFAVNPVQAGEQAAGLTEEVLERVSISGAIEVEATWSEDFDGESSSDISLATAEVALEGRLTNWAGATLALEWDDEEDKITVDEAFISLGSAELFPVQGQVGRFVVPFGVYDGNTIADPLTKEVFEAKEDALLAGFEFNDFAGGIYFFNGDSSDGGGDDIEHFGLFAGYTLETETIEVGVQLGYLNSVFDADGLTDAFDGEADYVDGVAVQARLIAGHYNGRGNVFIHTERITTVSPESANGFADLLADPDLPGAKVYVTGEKGREICREGGRLIIPRRPANPQGGCRGCSGCRRENGCS
jgi:hypothetical protein